MASINKTSVRDELDRIKSEFKRQHDTNAMTHENMLLMKSMLTLLELIISIFLEKLQRKIVKIPAYPLLKRGRMNRLLMIKAAKERANPKQNRERTIRAQLNRLRLAK